MPWAELDHTREHVAPRKPRITAQPPKLTLYKDGLAKLNASARAAIPHHGAVHLLHDPERPTLVGLAATGGENPHKLSKTGTLSAVPLWRHAGKPQAAVHVPLRVMGDILVGDLAEATAAPLRGGATVATSEAERPSVPSGPNGPVDPSGGPGASAPSDSDASPVDVVYEPAEDYEEALY